MLFQNIDVKKIELKKIVSFQIYNSMAMSMVAFVISFSAVQLGYIITAKDSGLSPVLQHPLIDFANYNIDWNIDIVSYVYSSGVFMSALTFFISTFLYFIFKKKNGLLHLLFIWLIFHSLNLTLVQLIETPWSRCGIGAVLQWHYWSRFAHWVLALASMLGLVLMGIFITVLFLKTAYTSRLIKTFKQKTEYYYKVIGFPIITTNVFAFIFNSPIDRVGTLMILLPIGSILIFLGGFFSILMFQKIMLVRHSEVSVLTKNGILVLIFLFISLRLLLLKSFWF